MLILNTVNSFPKTGGGEGITRSNVPAVKANNFDIWLGLLSMIEKCKIDKCL